MMKSERLTLLGCAVLILLTVVYWWFALNGCDQPVFVGDGPPECVR